MESKKLTSGKDWGYLLLIHGAISFLCITGTQEKAIALTPLLQTLGFFMRQANLLHSPKQPRSVGNTDSDTTQHYYAWATAVCKNLPDTWMDGG